MSIQTQITRIENAKTSIKQAIINKGVSVSTDKKLEDYATLIDSINTGSGGSTNIETFHITSKTETINNTITGTVSVWGYGYYSQSTYSKTTYAFVGDGYYTATSYGNPSKKSSTFSISNGTLSGLPTNLTSVDLLVVIEK